MLSNVQTIGERFEAADADTIVIVGASGQDWPTYMGDNTDYRPKLLFLELHLPPRAFYTNVATTDTSVLEGSLVGGTYGPDTARFDEEAMQECVETLSDAGLDTPRPRRPVTIRPTSPTRPPFRPAPTSRSPRPGSRAAGEDLNYGTLAAAADGLEVHIPGDPGTLVFGPPPAGDGNPQAYLFEWDPDAENYASIED